MDNLNQLSHTGLPVFDLNNELLERSDWAKTPLGGRDQWSPSLTCLVNLVTTFPHSAAIFWGDDLSIIHNLAWGKAAGNLDGQGAKARDSYSGEALSSIQSAIRGRTVKAASRTFLPDLSKNTPESIVLLSTLLDADGKRQGVLAQLLQESTLESQLPLSGLNKVQNEHKARRTKDSATQQTDSKDKNKQIDYKETQLFQNFAELLPNGLAILDSEAEAVFVNDNFFKLTTNKTSKEFRAWPESIDQRDYENVMSAYRKAFSLRKELRVEFRCAATAEDEWRLFLLRPLSDETEAGFIAAIVDITEIKNAQLTQEKAATEARERKEQQERFIDMVSHEIRNPLSAVLHLAEEIKEVIQEIGTHYDGCEQIADILDAADTILLCVSHQNVLVDDILSFSKLDSMMLSLVPREVQPKWAFSTALKVFHSEFKAKDINFHYAMDVTFDELEVDFVVADINRMKQVLVNLVTNAIKFTSKKHGKRDITVSMGASIERPTSYPPNVVFFQTPDDAFHFDSTLTNEWGNGEIMYLMVAVKDTGIGISANDQAKLFERFRQATPKTHEKYGGTGLGLFISRKLTHLHGGEIGVSSKEGEGSTFGFCFKVRRSDGSSEDGRPPFGRNQSRTSVSSDSSDTARRSTTPRPKYNRAESSLQRIKERPKMEKISSHKGVNTADVDDSLKNPPTEYREESHMEKATHSSRYKETEKISENIRTKYSSPTKEIEAQLPNLELGETVRQADAAEARSSSHSKEIPKTRKTLLLVEDNLINQKVLRRQLQSRGFEVFTADNGQEAIDAVIDRAKTSRENFNRCNYFDCILMDQEMPIKDGNTATMEIRELQNAGECGRSPILGISANVREVQTESMLEAGMDKVIKKPFKVDDLVNSIRSIISKQ